LITLVSICSLVLPPSPRNAILPSSWGQRICFDDSSCVDMVNADVPTLGLSLRIASLCSSYAPWNRSCDACKKHVLQDVSHIGLTAYYNFVTCVYVFFGMLEGKRTCGVVYALRNVIAHMALQNYPKALLSVIHKEPLTLTAAALSHTLGVGVFRSNLCAQVVLRDHPETRIESCSLAVTCPRFTTTRREGDSLLSSIIDIGASFNSTYDSEPASRVAVVARNVCLLRLFGLLAAISCRACCSDRVVWV
jgi:hypothetical protein